MALMKMPCAVGTGESGVKEIYLSVHPDTNLIKADGNVFFGEATNPSYLNNNSEYIEVTYDSAWHFKAKKDGTFHWDMLTTSETSGTVTVSAGDNIIPDVSGFSSNHRIAIVAI